MWEVLKGAGSSVGGRGWRGVARVSQVWPEGRAGVHRKAVWMGEGERHLRQEE